MEAWQGWLGLHKDMPYPEQWDWQQLRTAKITSQPAPEAPSSILLKLAASPTCMALSTVCTSWCGVGSFANPSMLIHCASCCAAAPFSHPFLFPTWPLQRFICPALLPLPSQLPTLNDCSLHAPWWISFLSLQMGFVPSDQLINYILVRLCSVFFWC